MSEALFAPTLIERRPIAASLRNIPSLDGLRAVSVLMVFFAHAGLDHFIPGGLGVTIFFFLSGFLITTLLRAEFEKNDVISVKHFWLRRALRIMPPFYLVLTATVIASTPGTLNVFAVLAQFFNFTNYWVIVHGSNAGQPIGTGIFWSLAVEEHFYLIFPWLYIGLRKWKIAPREQALLLWALCALILLWRFVLILYFHSTTDRTYLATDTRVDSILFGCALAVWRNPVIDRPRLDAKAWQFILVPAAFFVLFFCLVYRADVFRETLRYTLQGAALTFIFIAAMEFKEWPVFRVLNVPAVAFLGVLSYSIYLVHFPILHAAKTILDSQLAASVLALFVSIGTAWLIHLLIEKPCASLRRRLID